MIEHRPHLIEHRVQSLLYELANQPSSILRDANPRNHPLIRAIKLLDQQDSVRTRIAIFGILGEYTVDSKRQVPAREAVHALSAIVGHRQPRIPTAIEPDLKQVVSIWMAWGQLESYVH